MKIGEEVADLAKKSLPVNKPNAAPVKKQKNLQSVNRTEQPCGGQPRLGMKAGKGTKSNLNDKTKTSFSFNKWEEKKRICKSH